MKNNQTQELLRRLTIALMAYMLASPIVIFFAIFNDSGIALVTILTSAYLLAFIPLAIGHAVIANKLFKQSPDNKGYRNASTASIIQILSFFVGGLFIVMNAAEAFNLLARVIPIIMIANIVLSFGATKK